MATITAPSANWNGSETITFTATDPGLETASDDATFTVTAANDAPVVAGIPDQTAAEGDPFSTIALDDYVDDIDNADSVITWTTIGEVQLSVSIDANRIATITALDSNWNGSETISFIATDPLGASDTDQVTFTVTPVNDAPLVEGIPDQSIPDGGTFAPINLDDYVTDIDDDDSLIVWTASGNVELLVDITNRVATVTVPTSEWTGTETIIFRGTDPGALFDEDTAVFTVTAENDPPVVTGIPGETISEGGIFASISLDDYVDDPDNLDDEMVWTASNNVELIVTISNRIATITTPDPDYFGTENIIFRATDPGGLFDEDTALFTVTNVEDAPVLDSIGPKSVMETNTLSFLVTASDVDGTIPQLSADNLPLNATFFDSANGVGLFEFTPDLTQSGVYNVLFVASDALAADSESVQIIVNEIGNQPPTIATIDPQTTLEGDTLQFLVSATDPEGEGIQLFMNTENEFANFVDSGNGTGVFTFTPDYFGAGVDTIVFIALDGGTPGLSDNERVQITTLDVNQPPEIDSVGPKSVLLGETLYIHITATDSTDPDGGRLYFTALQKPANSTFLDSTTNAALFTFTPDASQVGEDTLRVICFDDQEPSLSDIEIIPITIVSANLPPVLDPIGPKTVTEGDTLIFNITASDPDGPSLSLSVQTLPENAEFVDSGNGVGTFTFAPGFLQSGLVQVKFIASDGIANDFENVFIQIYDNPQAPILTIVPDTSITEGEHLEFSISATDPDNTTPELILDNPAINATFTDNGDGTGLFEFDPVFVQAGVYDFLFIAADGVLADSGTVTVTVQEAGNQPPILNAPDTVSGQETDLITFTVTVEDADSAIATLTTSTLPTGSSFTDSTTNKGTFEWQTANLDQGTYNIWIYAADGDDPAIIDSAEVVVVVTNLNLPPSKLFIHQIEPDSSTFPVGITSATIDEGELLLCRIESEDPDNIPCSLSVALYNSATDAYSPIPNTATLVDSANGMGSFEFIPSFTQAGTFVFRFIAIDRSTLADSLFRNVTVVVNDVPQAPVIDTILPQSVVEGDSLGVLVTFDDFDSPPPALLAENLPVNAYMVNEGDPLSRLFVFKPYYDQAGNYTVRFIARDDTNRADTMEVSIEVVEAGPQPPILDVPLPSNLTLRLGDSLSVRITAVDPEGVIPSLRYEGNPGPPNAVFVDSANGAGSFFYEPEELHVGFTYNLDFISSDGALEDTVRVVVDIVSYICGDANGDELVNVSDAVYILNYIFAGGAAPVPLVAADANGSTSVNVSDAVYLINYIFVSGPAPICEGGQ